LCLAIQEAKKMGKGVQGKPKLPKRRALSKRAWLAVLIGSFFLTLVCVAIVFFIASPTRVQYSFLAIVLALGAAGFSAALPGTFEFQWAGWAKGTSAFGVLGMVLAVMFVIFPYSSIELATISGHLELRGASANEDVRTDLHFAIRPPDAQPYDSGEFVLTNVPIDRGTRAATNLVILKKGKYIVIKKGNEYAIDDNTPIVLEKEEQLPASPAYSDATPHVPVPTSATGG
jgi:hypothetical protein